MTTGIYGIYDSNSQDCLYVGQSIFIEGRWAKHLSLLRRGKHRQQRFVEWVKTNGEDSLNFRILEECEDDETLLNKLEMKWFRIEDPKFYSKAPSENDRWRHESGTKKKISESMKEKYSEEPKLEKVCKTCGNLFLTNHFNQVNCLKKGCYSEFSRISERKCPQCGKAFLKKRIHCSRECAGKASSQARYTDEDVSKMCELYVAGFSLAEIAKFYPISRQTVYLDFAKEDSALQGGDEFRLI